MQTFLLVIHVLLAFSLIGLILLQHGKGADVGAAFGSGASSTVFGARGSASFLTRATAVLAILFFSNSFFLAYLSANRVGHKSVMEQVQTTPGQKVEKGEFEMEKAQIKEIKKEPASELPNLPASEKPKSDLPSLPGKRR